MRTGFNIVIGGESFNPDAALDRCLVKPDAVVRRGEKMADGRTSSSSFVEWGDWRLDQYPLDMVTEAMDFIATHQRDFECLLRAPDIELRSLNFVDSARDCSDFRFSREQIELLSHLEFEVSIVVQKEN